MVRKVISLSIDDSDIIGVLESRILLDTNNEDKVVENFRLPEEYNYEVLINSRVYGNSPDFIDIKGLEELYKVIDNEDSLPDIGLLDYELEELDLSLKNITLRELYKTILVMLYKGIW